MNKQQQIKKFTPNYEGSCDCGHSPVVVAETTTGNTIEFWQCGPCLFGDAGAIDPDEWNSKES